MQLTIANSKQQLNGSKKVTTGEGACHAHCEADGDGEETEQNQVDRVLLAVEVERTQHCKTPKCNSNIFSLALTIRSDYTPKKIQPRSPITMQLGEVTLTRTFPTKHSEDSTWRDTNPSVSSSPPREGTTGAIRARKASPTRGWFTQLINRTREM
jgi:hypothetical protein